MPSWPGSSTDPRSSLTTVAPGPGWNSAARTPPLADRVDAWAPVSEDPSESLISRSGSTSRNSALSVALNTAPPLPSTNNDDVS